MAGTDGRSSSSWSVSAVPPAPPDSPADIAADLHQLADEVLGNATRPSAIDIAARCNQAAKRLERLVAVQAAGRATLSSEEVPGAPVQSRF